MVLFYIRLVLFSAVSLHWNFLASAQSGDDVKNLIEQLFVTNGYSKKVRPLQNQTEVVHIPVDFYLTCKAILLSFLHSRLMHCVLTAIVYSTSSTR